MLARGPNPYEAAHGWVGGVAEGLPSPKGPVCQTHLFSAWNPLATPLQLTPLQPPRVIALGLHRFLWSWNGSEAASNETKGSLSINSMGSGSGPTSVWPSLYTAQPIYSLSIPGPLSPIVSIFFLLMAVISPKKHHSKKKTACAPLAANPLVWHSSECCPNPLPFQQGSLLSLFRFLTHPFELPNSFYPSLPIK